MEVMMQPECFTETRQAVQAANTAAITEVSLFDLSYPVEVWDDRQMMEEFISYDQVTVFIRGYAWGTANYPEVPPLRVIQYGPPKDGEAYRVERGRKYPAMIAIVELQSPLIIREGTQADEDARIQRTQHGLRMVTR